MDFFWSMKQRLADKLERLETLSLYGRKQGGYSVEKGMLREQPHTPTADY